MSRLYAIVFLMMCTVSAWSTDARTATMEGQINDPNTTGQAQGGFMGGWFMFILLGFVGFMIFSASRSQRKEQRRHQELVSSLKTGQQVVTAGGVHGKVVRKGESTVDLATGENGATIITFGINAITKTYSEESDDTAPSVSVEKGA